MIKRSFSTGVSASAVNIWLLLARVVVGASMLTHGIPKLQKLMAGGEIQFADPFGLGAGVSLVLVVFAEVLCSILLIFGFATRLASVPIIITMLVAIFYAHGSDPFGRKELPIMFLLLLIGFCMMGAGRYSIDHLLQKKNARSRY